MLDVKTLDRFATIMVNGITPASFPIIMSEVYLTVVKTKGLNRDEIRGNCIELLQYIIDNTNVGENGESLNGVAKKLIPGMVDAFMMVEHRRFGIKWFPCF